MGLHPPSVWMTTMSLTESSISSVLRPDAVKGEGAVGEPASRGAADPDTAEDGATIVGVNHAPRISTPSSDCFATHEAN